MTPHTRYAKSGDVNIAYQVVGQGPIDLVVNWGWLSHVEMSWEDPDIADFLSRLASFSRLIVFDKRGTGMYGLAALAHVGPFYLVTAAVLGGAWLSQAGMPRANNRAGSPS